MPCRLTFADDNGLVRASAKRNIQEKVTPMGNAYEIYALRYATMSPRTPNMNFLAPDPHDSAAQDLDYFVWLIRGGGREILVDTGFNAEEASARARKLTLNPVDALERFGVAASSVRDIIVTHLHYDHAGNLDRFPNARFHLQEREMAYATGRCMCHAAMRQAFAVDDITAMVRHLFAGRVAFHDGDAELAPGLSVHRIGGHTQGLQAVRVHTRVGWIVLASDAAHLYANMHDVRPFPIVFDVGRMVEGYRRLRELADAPELIVPGHDPLVMQRYAAPHAALEGIAVRLDMRPEVA